jgi:succinate dehydrogenase / fumarate reductase, cytochrome b subunit
MSTTLPSKRQHRTNSLPSGRGLWDWLSRMLGTSVGLKYLVAISGIALTGFVIAHLVGNLSIFAGRHAINEYAFMLKKTPALLWTARLGLLAFFLLHVIVSLRLKYMAAQARPIGYAYEQTVQASLASRTMWMSGLVILVFLIFHLAHYTLGVVQHVPNAEGKIVPVLELREPRDPADPNRSPHHDVYAMTYYGFHNPVLAVLYVIAQLILILHLSHGVPSMFQTLGANAPRVQGAIRLLGWAVALFVGVGNILIVVAVWGGAIPPPY